MSKKKQKKIFVLDTSVILHDHNSLHCFEENDIAIPITVLEELDNFKRGNDTKNFEARAFIRVLDRVKTIYVFFWRYSKSDFMVIHMVWKRQLNYKAIYRIVFI